MENQTALTEFLILGFELHENLRILVVTAFSVIYIITIFNNAVIIFVIKAERALHTAMYFFLVNLSFLEICYVTVIFPTMLKVLLMQTTSLSFTACMTQLYFFLSLACIETFLLATMAFDRYMAICQPLRYSAIMNNNACLKLASGSWIAGFMAPIVPTVMTCKLIFCGSNKVDHFFCDLAPLLRLSCNDNGNAELVSSIFAAAVLLSSCCVTILSYVRITCTVCKMSTSKNLQKHFTTCSSHLIVVVIFYFTGLFSYVFLNVCPSLNLRKEVSLLYSVGTPFINPFIYTLRNKDVKVAMKKILLVIFLVKQG
ncbi:olfactory receptor 6F1-like [Ascaphus truei]|uniref:olfactory receptor 6F1-like n=1 Tax=Ascaphus truei TaxID=8439 RepID=UPI003F5A53FC